MLTFLNPNDMTELELAQHTTDVTRWVAYFGFALWGAAGWYVGRWFLRRNEPVINKMNRIWVKENKKNHH